jgi:hypothetical protein
MLRYIANPRAAQRRGEGAGTQPAHRVALTREGRTEEEITTALQALNSALCNITGDEYPTGLEWTEAVEEALTRVLAGAGAR